MLFALIFWNQQGKQEIHRTIINRIKFNRLFTLQ